jgi:hypothetical protein
VSIQSKLILTERLNIIDLQAYNIKQEDLVTNEVIFPIPHLYGIKFASNTTKRWSMYHPTTESLILQLNLIIHERK